MLLTHVQAAPNGSPNSFHIQATGPAFPQGYASGDVTLKVPTREVFIPSMRGSGRKYFQLTAGEVEANLATIVAALGAPCPRYDSSASTVAAVSKRVQLAIDTAKAGPPKPAPATVAKSASKCDIDEATVEKVVRAVIAALKA